MKTTYTARLNQAPEGLWHGVTHWAPTGLELRLLQSNVRLSTRRSANSDRPCREAIVHTNVVYKPTTKRAAIVVLGRLKEHEFTLDALALLHLSVAADEDNLVIFAVWIRRDAVSLGLALLILPLGDKLAHFALKVHQQALCAARTLELLAQLLGNHSRDSGLVRDRFSSVLRSSAGNLTLGRLALQTGVPQRCEVVWYVADAVSGVNLPILWRRGLSVRVVQEAI
jgi:hypothetical protein